MSLLLTFMELDKLYESESWIPRQTLIDNIKDAGMWLYKFEKYSDKQLYRIWERIQKEAEEAAAMKEYHDMLELERQKPTCNRCGRKLNDGGTCFVCDDGEEDYPLDESLLEWVDSTGKRISAATQTSNASSTPVATSGATTNNTTANIVTIVYDNSKHKLRAQADDGIHGIGNVAFPNDLRTKAGQQYEVETLTWNGKNYRVSGGIKPI